MTLLYGRWSERRAEMLRVHKKLPCVGIFRRREVEIPGRIAVQFAGVAPSSALATGDDLEKTRLVVPQQA